VKKVVFNLHPSFDKPVRSVEVYPFELHSAGWGEFEIGIKIFFHDATENPIELFHGLKLFPDPARPHYPVISEQYDELVFNNPRESFAQRLQKHRGNTGTNLSEEAEFAKIIEAKNQIRAEVNKQYTHYQRTQKEIGQLRAEIAQLGGGIH